MSTDQEEQKHAPTEKSTSESDKEEHEEKESESKKSTTTINENGGTSSTDEIRKIIQEEIRSLFQEESSRSQMRRVDIETQAEKMVQDAVQRLSIQKLHDADHERLRSGEGPSTDKPAELEQVPIKTPKLRKLLWGEE